MDSLNEEDFEAFLSEQLEKMKSLSREAADEMIGELFQRYDLHNHDRAGEEKWDRMRAIAQEISDAAPQDEEDRETIPATSATRKEEGRRERPESTRQPKDRLLKNQLDNENLSTDETDEYSWDDEEQHNRQDRSSRKSGRTDKRTHHRKNKPRSSHRKRRDRSPSIRVHRRLRIAEERTKKRKYRSPSQSEDSSTDSSDVSREVRRCRSRKYRREGPRDGYSFTNNLPTFDGKFHQWKIFKDLISQLVFNNDRIPDSMKKSIVLQKTSGTAEKRWIHETNQTSRVHKAWKKMAEYYEDSSRIQVAIQEAIDRMKKVKNNRDTEGLIELRERVHEFQGLMSDLGREYRAQARSYTIYIAHKVDERNGEKMITECESLGDVIRMLDKLIRNATTLNLYMKMPDREVDRKKKEGGYPYRTMVASINEQYMKCHLCESDNDHFTSECQAIKELNQLLSKIREKRLCHRCLCSGHRGNRCPNATRISCRKCHRNHSTATCGFNVSMHFAPRNINHNNQSTRVNDNTEATGHTLSVPPRNEVIRPQVSVVNEDRAVNRFWINVPFKRTILQVLIDTGASISMISENCIPQNQRRAIPPIVAHGYGEGMSSTINEVAEVEIASLQGMVKLKAYLCKAMRKDTLIIGRDQMSLILRGDDKCLRTVFGDFDFAEKVWDEEERIQQLRADTVPWHEDAREEEVDRAAIDMSIERLDSGRYGVKLPFLSEDRPRDNFRQACKKLTKLVRRLTDKGLMTEYNLQIQEWITSGYVEEICEETGHFIGHREVERPEAASTPLRVVLTPLELNGFLWKGESFGLDVLPHLIRLRSCRWALTADLRKAFLQIEIAPQDRRFLRFLWIKDNQTVKYQMKVLPFGVVSAPAILTQVIGSVVCQLSPSSREVMLDSIYMDDVLACHNDPEVLMRAFQEAKSRLSEAGFCIHKERSNMNHDELDKDAHAENKVLGLVWNPERDTLRVNVPTFAFPSTRRELLSAIGKLFDPFGMYDPIKLGLRALFAQVLRLEWDAPLPFTIQEEAQQQIDLIQRSPPLEITRPIMLEQTLRGFCDASKRYFGYVFYVGEQFVFGRAKVLSPNRTIVDAELQALFEMFKALPKILKMLNRRMKIEAYSDSAINLDRLHRSPNTFPIVEARRLFYVLKVATQSEVDFYHVSGTSNPADFYSRKSLPEEMDRWLNLNWQEITACRQPKVTLRVICASSPTETAVEEERTAALFRAFLITLSLSAQYRYVDRLKALRRKASGNQKACRQSTLADLIFMAQQDAGFRPPECYLRDGIWCYPSRDLSKTQMWVPSESRLATLLLQEAHQLSLHRGKDMSLAMLPRAAHIQNGNRRMKALISRCMRCRQARAKAISQPLGPLHLSQCRFLQPFERIAMDVCGPFTIKTGKKYWCLLVLCLTSRAVKLHTIENLTGDVMYAVLQAIWERGGFPKQVHSDHGSNFVGAYNRIRKELSSRTIDLSWTWSTPNAPWMNGAAERLISVTKGCLDQFLAPAKALYEVERRLATVESVINSRPVLYIDGQPVSAFRLAYGRELILNPNPEAKRRPFSMAEHRQQQQFEIALAWKSQFLRKMARYDPKKGTEIRIGDAFLVPDLMKRRAHWGSGIALDVKKGQDGLCRSIYLQLNDGTTNWRPAQALIPLTFRRAEAVAEPASEVEIAV